MTDNGETTTKRDELNIEPILQPIYGGRWAAHGLGWAVHADTQEAAIRAYWERVALYRAVEARGINDMPRRKQNSEDTHA